jgi:Uncharacterized protein conserved in bacteria C-term(DUF2220)
MWERDEDRLALLELLVLGRLRRRAGQREAWEVLEPLRWTRATGRRDELMLVGGHEGDVEAVLDRSWPGWREERAELEREGLPCTPKGWQALEDRRRAAKIGELPERLNKRTATSAVGPHSKAGLGERRRAALGGTEITHDGSVRLRPPAGLRVVRGSMVFDAVEIAGVLGEVVITERAFRDGTRLVGTVEAVLLVENLGPYQDLEPPAGWLVAHVPGWDTRTVRVLLEGLAGVPVVHFGDLDPAGVRIVQHLRGFCPGLRWAVPEFWSEYVEERALVGRWPEGVELDGAPRLVRDLARRGLWMEQEVIALDPRLTGALRSVIAGD